MEKTNWKELRNEVLTRLDVKGEFAKLGVVFGSKQEPNANGWVECHAYGRDDKSCSAGVNVLQTSPQFGRYKEFVGNGRSMTLFDFAVDIGKFSDFSESIKYYATAAGLAVPRGRPPEGPESQLVFRDWDKSIVNVWCKIKPPITPQAVELCGGKLAEWPKKWKSNRFNVIALPSYPNGNIDADPNGWTIYSVTGANLPLYQGEGVPDKMLKSMCVKHSECGLMGRYSLAVIKHAELIWKVEGPPDMLALQTAILRHSETCGECVGSGCDKCKNKGVVYPYIGKHVVVTNSNGAMETPTDSYMLNFARKRVYVVGDQDVDGQKGAMKWTNAAARVADQVKNVKLPYKLEDNHGKDLRDWFNEGHTYAELLSLADSFDLHVTDTEKKLTKSKLSLIRPDRDSEALSPQHRICNMLNIQVVGETPKMGIEVFSLTHGKTAHIPKVSYLTYEELIQICGEGITEFVNQNNQVTVPGTVKMKQIQQAIAILGGYQMATEETKTGLGCWSGLNADKTEKNSVVVVGGHEGFEWDHEKQTIEVIRQPIWGGRILDLKNSDTWYDLDIVSEYLAKSADPKWSNQVVEQLISIFSHWNWKFPKYTPHVVAGLVLASWVQTLWYWRPMVAISGASDSGKSTLFEVLEGVFGPLAMRSAKSSEAGIRQSLKNNALVLMDDEFEDDVNRNKKMELFRTSSKGDKMLKGTASQGGATFGLKHIIWVAAIELGMKREPDKNRYIQLELQRPKASKRGVMDWLPPPHELADMGMKLLAIAIRNVPRAKELANHLRKFRKAKVEGRVIESYAVPVAMLATITGNSEDVADAFMDLVLSEIEFDGYVSQDENELMQAIISSQVYLGGAQGSPSVGQILSYGSAKYMEGTTGMEKCGVGVVEGLPTITSTEKIKYLFIDPRVVCRVLLKDTEWKNQDISQILQRINGAQFNRHRIAGKVSRGVRIPYKFIQEQFLGDSDTQNDGFVAPEEPKTN